MCGIAGYWNALGQAQSRDHLGQALHKMRHRGPNDHGVAFHKALNGEVALGHARLSVIDLTAGGHQPMATRDGSLSIVFNGEIYNYIELRKELEGLGREFAS